MLVSVFPVLVGMLLRAKWPAFTKATEPYISKFSIIVLALLIVSIAVDLGDELWRYIVAAGPAANLLLAVVLYAVVNWSGVEEPKPVLASPVAGSIAGLPAHARRWWQST